MQIDLLKGKYVVAVSGGVDSVVLLNLLNKQRIEHGNVELVVAHFDHGIRSDSSLDRKFVEDVAKKLQLKFSYKEGNLGKGTSEELARKARYEFLNKFVKKEGATCLITAHHQDDLIETAIINIIRGTGRKGLSSLSSNNKVIRPLLGYPKTEIISYAKKHKLAWREDETNQDVKYLRNYVRHNIVPKLDTKDRNHLIAIINKQSEINSKIDKELAGLLNDKTLENQLPRLWLNSLDSLLSQEVIAAWLRQNDLASFDRPMIERLAASLKTVGVGKRIDVLNGWQIAASRDNLALVHVER